MIIKQGDIYWVNLGEPTGSEPGYRHPTWCYKMTYSMPA